MTYPGTKPRERTALESSLTADVLRLERERDELVEALHLVAHYAHGKLMDQVRGFVTVSDDSAVALVRRVFAKYPRSSAGS